MRKLNGIKIITTISLLAATFGLSVLFIKVSEKNNLNTSKEVQASEETLNALDCYVCEKLTWNQDYTEVEIEKDGVVTILNMKEEIEERKRIEAEERRLARLEAERIAEEKRQAEIAEQKRQEEIAIRLAEEKKKRDAEREKQKRTEVVSRGNNYKDASNWMTFQATYYGADCYKCSGITALGIDVRNTIYHNGMRVIAVDPNVIPLGSTVQVKTPHGTFNAIAGDTGGDIKQFRIDILVESEAVSYQYGRHNVQLRIIQ